MTTPTDEGMSAPAQFLTDPTPATIEQLQFRAINRLRSLLLAGGAVAAPDEVRACVADAINLVQAAIFDARALAARAAVEANTPNSEALAPAIKGHLDGWASATFGWQDDPDPAQAERNKQAAIQAHAAECLRRIRETLARNLPGTFNDRGENHA